MLEEAIKSQIEKESLLRNRLDAQELLDKNKELPSGNSLRVETSETNGEHSISVAKNNNTTQKETIKQFNISKISIFISCFSLDKEDCSDACIIS